MRQVKRLFYMVLLNIIISAITVGVILQLWERDHPAVPAGTAETTPMVIVVTPTGAVILPMVGNSSELRATLPAGINLSIPGTLQAAPTLQMISYMIKEGDTLGALAIQFNSSVADILTVNNLADPDSLYVGQIIYIPTAPLPTATFTSTPTSIIPSATIRASSTPTPRLLHTATPTPTGQAADMVIETVIGAGALQSEHVVLRRTGDGELSMAGWRLIDGKGNEYIFPQLTLYKDRAINLNTRSGQDTVLDLFWGLASPIWSSGETVSVYDAQNRLRSTYTIP